MWGCLTWGKEMQKCPGGVRAPEYHVGTVLEARRVGPGHRRRAASQGCEAGTREGREEPCRTWGSRGCSHGTTGRDMCGERCRARVARGGKGRREGRAPPPRGPESSSGQGPPQGLRAARTEGSENALPPPAGRQGAGTPSPRRPGYGPTAEKQS